MKYIKSILLVIIFAIRTGLVVFIAQKYGAAKDNTTAVVKEIRALNRWETSSFTVEKIIDSESSGNVFQQFLFGNSILLIAHGEVIGGFDLSQFSEKDISTQGTSITLTLPAPGILLSRIDNSKTRIYDRKQGLLVAPNNNLESDSLASAETSIRAAACTEGILNSAATNAKNQLTPLLTSFGFTSVTISIPEGHC